MADTGDPRFAAPIWEGRYEVTPAEGVTLSSTTVMLTKANQCQLCGDAEGVTAGTAFATLPEACRPERVLHLPVCVGGSGSESVSLEGTVTIAGQTATGTVSVPGQTVDVSLTVPEREASGSASVQEASVTGTATLTSEAGSQTPMLVSGEFNEEGELVSAYSMNIVNNTTPLTMTGDVDMTVPSQSAEVSVRVASTEVQGSVDVAEVQGSASVEIGEQEVPVTVSGTIATGGLATLTIGTDGTMTCSSGGTVYLDGFSYHICDRWY